MKGCVFILMLFSVGGCNSSGKNAISLWGTAEEIKAEILAKTPVGSSVTFVNKFISSYPHEKIIYPEYLQSTGVKIRGVDTSQTMSIVGNHSLRMKLGTYRDPKWLFLFKIDVYVDWAFNKSDELIDVFVDKYNRPS